jgi:hypothetical protein
MPEPDLRKRKAQLESDLEKLKAQVARIQGAILLATEILEEGAAPAASTP